MCGCCSSSSTEEINNRSVTSTKRSSSIIFENFSKLEDIKKKYEYISTLGNGAFGKVKLYRDKECKSIFYAIKTIKKKACHDFSIESIKREVNIIRSLDHPNIVKYFETYEDDVYLNIVMEYIPGDNLFNMITNRYYNNFTEKDIKEIMTFLLRAVLFLHLNGIVHRDIKPENILFGESNEYSSLKLIDFGLSIERNARNERYRVGSPYYMAPEMVYDGKFYFESDMWSIGVILFILVTGSQPFKGKNREELFKKISEGKYDKRKLKNQRCSDELKDLISKILIVDHNKRIKVDEALNHEWFKKGQQISSEAVNSVISPDIIQAIKNFQNQNLLQKEVLYVLAKISTDQEVKKLKNAFSLIDKDNSGEIEYEEIPKIFADLNLKASDEELKNIFDSLDFHNDGKVNYSEFIAATLSSIDFAGEERLKSVFRYFDNNNQGYVTVNSIIDSLKQNNVVIDETELKRVFQDLDMKNGKLNFQEFKEIFFTNNISNRNYYDQPKRKYSYNRMENKL